MTDPLRIFDQPNSYIGRSVPRPDANRLLSGRGCFIDDITLPRMLHAAFVRSPHAHARITSIDIAGAKSLPGVVAVLTGRDLEDLVTPYVGVLTHLQGLRSAPQMPMAVDVARWQGEPVAMVIATGRAVAEDACALVDVGYDPLDAACNMTTAMDGATPVIHPEFGNNLAWERLVEAGDIDAAFARDDVTVVERTFPLQPPHGGDIGATQRRGRLQSVRPGTGLLLFWPGTAHDAGHPVQTSRTA